MPLQRLLKDRFGHNRFREGQEAIITHLLSGKDALVVMPTGAGKSLCYQLPALALGGTTLVVSPLIALMKDQVDSLQKAGVRATYINSTVPPDERRSRLVGLRNGDWELLYVAPERFSDRFVEFLNLCDIRLFAIDEAHCLSQWGHDFRPDYLRLGAVREALHCPTTIALTATATPEVQKDILHTLRMPEAEVVVQGFERKSLDIEVIKVANLQEKRKRLPSLVSGKSALVYAATRKNVEKATRCLQEAGIQCGMYHGGLDHSARTRVQEAFLDGHLDVVVATNAFGMGVDRSDVRCVIHWDLPGSLEAYYQEIGRAGRDGLSAKATLLFNPADRRTQEFFIRMGHPNPADVVLVYNALLEQNTNPVYFHPEVLADCLGEDPNGVRTVDSCISVLRREGWLSRARGGEAGQTAVRLNDPQADFALDEAKLKKRRDSEYAKLDAMLAFPKQGCRMHELMRYFGESPPPKGCGHCDVCADGGQAEPEELEGEDFDLACKVLRCIKDMRKPFSPTMVVRVLCGSTEKAVMAFRFDRLQGYGVLGTWNGKRIEALLEALVDAGALETRRVTRVIRGREMTYGELHIPRYGQRLISGKADSLSLVFPRPKRKHKPLAWKKPGAGIAGSSDLLALLKEVRRQLASTASVPAYVVASNRTLEEMANARPDNQAEMLAVHGMGPSRYAKYGTPFIDAIRGFSA
jgi:ATP-dependent DNA helicase RecQ